MASAAKEPPASSKMVTRSLEEISAACEAAHCVATKPAKPTDAELDVYLGHCASRELYNFKKLSLYKDFGYILDAMDKYGGYSAVDRHDKWRDVYLHTYDAAVAYSCNCTENAFASKLGTKTQNMVANINKYVKEYLMQRENAQASSDHTMDIDHEDLEGLPYGVAEWRRSRNTTVARATESSPAKRPGFGRAIVSLCGRMALAIDQVEDLREPTVEELVCGR